MSSVNSYVFKTVNDLKGAMGLANNDECRTLGYYEPNDGGGADYVIVNTLDPDAGEVPDDGGIIETGTTGLYAKLIAKRSLQTYY